MTKKINFVCTLIFSDVSFIVMGMSAERVMELTHLMLPKKGLLV